MLLRILDQICQEAGQTPFTQLYRNDPGDVEGTNSRRARAFIHLYLKVAFGLLNFTEREHFVTDGSYDGGIDGYYIDFEKKCIYLIQSKFRTTEANFANKRLTLEDLLSMDVSRILEGHDKDERGNLYNGKILRLQREIRDISDIARYNYRVVLLANIEAASPDKLSQLIGGFPCEIIDHEKCYELLVFPVLAGTYFHASDLLIHLDLSNKNAGSKINYTVDTRFGECDITVLFVPTVEIAKAFHRYKNSLLKFNPRSYLELEGQKVNESIRATIQRPGKNEFALYNNGITMLSDETNLNERIGQRNKAQLNVKNPQIINGGQTAYTLSRLYEELPSQDAESVFIGKEVLLKIITLSPGVANVTEEDKAALIESISEATNLQTAVITADRYSNEPANVELQRVLFDRYGLLYERKRGEFEDGLHNRYIEQSQLVERNLFFRIFFAANGDLKRAIQKRLFAKLSKTSWAVPSSEQLDRFYFAFLCFMAIQPIRGSLYNLTKEIYAMLYTLSSYYMPTDLQRAESEVNEIVESFLKRWRHFVATYESTDIRFKRTRIDRSTGQLVSQFRRDKWLNSGGLIDDIKAHFGTNRSGPGIEAELAH